MKTTKRKRDVKPSGNAEPAPPAASLTLSSTCTIKDAAALREDLRRLLAEEREVTIELGQLQRIDTATLQVLCAFARDRAERNAKVIWSGETPAWTEAVKLLGAGGLLGTVAA